MRKHNILLFSLILAILVSFSASIFMNPGSNNRIYIGFVLVVPFMTFFYQLVTKIFNEMILTIEGKFTNGIFFFVLIFGIAFLSSLIHDSNYIVSNDILIRIYYFMVFLIIMIASLLYIVINLKDVHWVLVERAVSKKGIIIYALPSIIVWIIYFIGFYPAIMTDDSFSQWNQMVTGQFNDWHPFMHTLFNLIVTRIWNSPAAISIAQILILSLTFGYGMYCLERFGVKRNIIYCAVLLFAINPVNGIMSITIWKDILYSNFIVLYTILIINIVLSKGNWINIRSNKMFFIFVSLGVLLFRHNGIVPIVGTMIFMIYLYKAIRVNITRLTFIIIGIYIIIQWPLYSIIGVKSTSSNEAFGIPTQQIAAVIKNNGYITSEQKERITKIMPLNNWSESYIPFNVDYIKFNKNFNSSAITNDKLGFLILWMELCIQNPKIVIRSYLDQTSILWSIKEQWPTNGGTRTISDNSFGIKQVLISPELKYIANSALRAIFIKDIKFVFWRPALPMFIFIFMGFICAIKNRRNVLLMISPVIFNCLSLAISIPAQDFRYLYSNNLVFCILIIALFVKVRDNNCNLE